MKNFISRLIREKFRAVEVNFFRCISCHLSLHAVILLPARSLARPIHADPHLPTCTHSSIIFHCIEAHPPSINVSILFIITRFDQYRYSLPSVISHWTCPPCSLGHVHNFFRVLFREFISVLGSNMHITWAYTIHPCQLYDDRGGGSAYVLASLLPSFCVVLYVTAVHPHQPHSHTSQPPNTTNNNNHACI